MDISDQNQENKQITVEDLNIEILPIIYEIIRSVEKDHHDTSAKTRESQDCSQKVLELQKRLDQARAQIQQLPGIKYNKEQQLHYLEALKTQLRLKQELLQKYRYILLANNEHLVQRLSESYPMRKAAQLIVRSVFRGKEFIENKGLDKKLTPEEFRRTMKEISLSFQNQIKQAHENLKKKVK